MLSTNQRKNVFNYSMVLVGLICLLLSAGSEASLAQNDNTFVQQVRIMEADESGISNPAGLSFSSRANAFHLVEALRQGQSPPAVSNIIKLTPAADRVGSAQITTAVEDPINMAFDNQAGRLLIFQSPANELIEVLEGADGNLEPTTLIRHDTQHFDLRNPQGTTVDPASGHLFILDATGPQIVRIEPEADGGFEEAVISKLDLRETGMVDVRGLAIDPTSGHLHVLSPIEQKLYELTQTGEVVTSHDLSEFRLRDPQGIEFAPSGDQTDDPTQMNLYIAGNGLERSSSSSQSGFRLYLPLIMRGMAETSGDDPLTENPVEPRSGQIIEFSFSQPPSGAATVEATLVQATLVQTIDTSQFSPPSPDPAGITYIALSNRLLVSDSEVNEIPSLFTGDNLFKMTLSGSLDETLTTISFSNEPTGVSYNPVNHHLFFSDDVADDIFEMDPGPDGLYDTTDDIITSFDTKDFNSNDPEGITYASGLGDLFIVDGVNAEVYRVSPGTNGIFDGVPPEGDDQATNFDTASLGLLDPEGIVYNPNLDRLYLVGKEKETLFEITTEGVLVQTVDISAANAKRLAGLAFAPSSQEPGVMNVYIADRRIDNDPDPNENDGKVYEFSFPTGLPNDPPVANDDSASTAEDTPGAINVAANDTDPEGNLDPTSTNTICPTCAEPTSGVLTNNGDGTFNYSPNLNFNGDDAFVYQICDTLSACDTATVTITVTPINDPPTATDDSASTVQGIPLTIDVAANDTDPDEDLNPASANTTCPTCAGPTDGTLTNNGDGSFDYTPNPAFTGNDSFVYQICDAQSACDTATVTINVGDSLTTIEVRVTASTDDAEEAANGGVGLTSSDLELVFDRGSNQTVGMRFTGLNIPQSANITTAYIQFQVDEANSGATSLIIQGQDTDNAATFVGVANNISSRPTTIASVSWAPLPWLTKGEAGPDQQTPNLAPIIQEIVSRPGWVSGNSLALIISGTGERTAESYNGTALGAPLLHVEYNTGPPNNPPTATDDSASTAEDTLVAVNVATNDTDPEGNLNPASANTTCSTCAEPTDGTLTNNGDGSFDYTPTLDFNGNDSFVYQICDAQNACDTATVSITVNPVADPPTANDDSATTTQDTPLTIDVAGNDDDPDGNLNPASANTTCPLCVEPTSGNLVNLGNGVFDYSPTPAFIGNDSFIYEICDAQNACDTATVSIIVNPINDPPTATNDTASTAEDTPLTINVAANDTDPDGNLAPASANTTCLTCAEPTSGALTNNGDGTFNYSPNLNFNGDDAFVYQICDTLSACDAAMVSITVTPINDPPVANDDSASTLANTLVIIDVAANDADHDGNLDPASANITCPTCTEPANGTLTPNLNGAFDYSPNPAFTGNDSFVYQICDAQNACDTATVSITVGDTLTIEVRVATGTDDAEEAGDGRVSLASSDLEFVFDRGSNQTVGMRFTGLNIPQGATITRAYIQFQVDEVNSGDTSLTIQGQDADNAATFVATNGNISSRPTTTAAVSWSPLPWLTKGVAGPDQQTPDIIAVIQEIVNRPGWASGNSLVLIISGTGERTAESYDGTPLGAPLLHVEYQ